MVLGAVAAVIGLFTAFGPEAVTEASRSVAWTSVAGLAVVIVPFATVSPERLDRIGAFLSLGVVGLVLLCVLSIQAGISSTGGQAFLAFAVLFGGFQLRPAGAVILTAVAVMADGVLLIALQPLESAITDLVFFGSMLMIMCFLLVRTGNAQERLVAALHEQAGVDALTGLVTRRVLDAALAAALGAAPEAGTALAVMDVDDFKSINDVHGHPVGDDALAHLAAVVTGQVRASDAVVGRLGGDEVAVLLTGCTPEVAARRAEQMLEAVRSAPLPLPDGTLLALSVSIGVAHAPPSATDLRTLYTAADAALYEAKRAGRDRVAFASSPG